MSGRKVVGLWGNIGFGKDTVGEIMVKDHGFKSFSFARALKELGKELFLLNDAQVFGPSANRNAVHPAASYPGYWARVYEKTHELEDRLTSMFPARLGLLPATVMFRLDSVLAGLAFDFGVDLTPRVALQRLGTEFGRHLWDGVWLEQVRRQIEESGCSRAVITDCRFANEAEFIRNELGGEVWWIDAEDRVGRRPEHAHASEATFEEARPYIDVVVDNNRTLQDLEGIVEFLATVSWESLEMVLAEIRANEGE